ncbi:MAG: nuclear transport factor 2 family protein [Myxococcota bacterium]
MAAGVRVTQSAAASEPSGLAVGRFIVKCNFLTTSLAAALALPLLFSLTASAGEDLGEKLIREFFADTKSRDLPAIEKTLAEGFQSVHTDGARDRAGELEIIRNIKLGAHTLANFKTTRNGPVMVVTFEVNAPSEILGGKRVGEGSYERLAVWLETGSGWQLIAYANLAPLNE